MSGRGDGTIIAPAPRPRSGLGLNELLGTWHDAHAYAANVDDSPGEKQKKRYRDNCGYCPGDEATKVAWIPIRRIAHEQMQRLWNDAK